TVRSLKDPPKGSQLHRVDPNYFALQIQQWSPRVAAVDGRIGLNQIAQLFERAFLGANDAFGNSRSALDLTRARKSDGDHVLADFDLVKLGKYQGSQIFLVDLEHGQIRRRISPYQSRGEPVAARQINYDRYVRPRAPAKRPHLDDMVVGQDVSVRRHYKA